VYDKLYLSMVSTYIIQIWGGQIFVWHDVNIL
jgi:hypothetical protein